MTSHLVAVTGASGALGSRVAARLARAGTPRRLIVRDPRRAAQLPGSDVQPVAGYHDAKPLCAALAGVDTRLLIPARELPDRVAQHRSAVDAAVAAGARRIVYLSFLGAAPDATFTLARDHWHTEQHIRATDLAWTFLRMNLYLDFLPTMVQPDGVIRGPAGDGQVAAIVRDDVAEAAAAVLASNAHSARTYDLTGPHAFTLSQAADTLSRAIGKAIRFENQTDAEAWQSHRASGAPDWKILGWISSYWAIRRGDLARVSTAVRELTGHDPVSLDAYAHATPHALDHVTAAAPA